MGYYKVSFDALESTGNAIRQQMNTALARLVDVHSALLTMINSDSVEGKTADTIKTYLSEIHDKIVVGMMTLVSAQKNNFSVYKNVYSYCDKGLHFVIHTEELQNICTGLSSNGNTVSDFYYDACAALRSIQDLLFVSVANSQNTRSGVISIETALSEMIENVENMHSSADFTTTGPLYYDLNSAMRSLRPKGTGADAFDTVDYSKTKALAESVSALAAEQQNKSEAIRTAEENEKTYQLKLEEEKEQQELEKREKEAEVFKVVVDVAAAVGTAAVIVAAPELGIVLAVGFGVGIGGTKGMLDATADEYAAHGTDISEYSLDNIITKTAREGTKTAIKTGAAAYKVAKTAVAAVTGPMEAIQEQIDEHGYNVDEFDWGEVFVDTGISISTAFVGDLIDYQSENLGDAVKADSVGKITKAVSDSGKKTFGDHLAEGLAEGLGESVKGQVDEHGFKFDEYDAKEIVTDTVIKGVESTVEGKIGDKIKASDHPVISGAVNIGTKEAEYVVETLADGEQLDAADAAKKAAMAAAGSAGKAAGKKLQDSVTSGENWKTDTIGDGYTVYESKKMKADTGNSPVIIPQTKK